MAYHYAPMFQLGPDQTEYVKLPGSESLVSTGNFEGHKILKVSKEALQLLAETAFLRGKLDKRVIVKRDTELL
mgnify:CR=1 FL=1